MYKIKTNETTESSCAGADLFKEDWLINADESFNNYDDTSGFKAKIEARIFYHNGSNPAPSRKLLRPIIVIDGFDPGDKRKIEDCDCADDPACVVKNLKDNIFEPKLHDSFYDLMDYKNNIGENKNLVNTLRSEGYDVILVNQPNYIHPTKPTVPAEGLAGLLGYTKPNIVDGGADYIERNALALVSLIKKVNSKLLGNGSKSQIAIFGPSMGGQISKYALAYMEKKYVETNNNDWQHNTYLWVSVDSPHLGANIPIGVQSLLNLAKDSSDGAKEFYEKNLRTPAAQQQLIELHREKPVINVFGTNYDYNNADPNYLNSQTISQNLPTNQGSSFFQQHYNNQNSNGVANSHGWPINLRKIALTNGSLTGSKETVLASGARGPNFANDGEKILNIRGFQRFNYDICWDPLCYFQSHITFRIHIASLESHFMPSPGNNARVSRFKKLFDDRTTNAFNNNSRGVMDNVPGGYFKSQSLVVDETLATDPVPGTDLSTIGNWSFSNISFGNIIKTISEQLGGSEWYLHEFNPNHSFIPTFSSLAILNPNQSWNNPLNTNLTCETDRQTPFDSYYGEAKNSEHTSFNYNSVKWLLLELEKNHQAPNFPIDQNALVGSKIICLNTNETTSFLDICKVPSAATWSVSDGLEIVSFTDYSVTVKLIPNQPTIITATFQNGQTLKKDIWAGPPSPPTIVNKSCYGGNDAPCYISNYPHDSYGIGAYGLSLEAYGLETNTNPNDWQWVSESANCGFSGFGLTINEAVSQRNGRETYIKFIMMNQQIPAEIKFKCRVKNICGWSEWRHFVFTFSDGVAEPVVVVPTYIKYFNISPNPGTSYTQINLIDPNVAPPSGAVVTAKLYSIFNPSAILYTIQLTNNTGYFYLSNLPSGYYAVDITFGNNSEGYTLIKN